jgi:hypothetical protein
MNPVSNTERAEPSEPHQMTTEETIAFLEGHEDQAFELAKRCVLAVEGQDFFSSHKKRALKIWSVLRQHVADETAEWRAKAEQWEKEAQHQAQRATEYVKAVAAATKALELAQGDKDRIDAIEANSWGVWHNDRAAGFIVQKNGQTVGNIGSGRTVRAAIDSARGAKEGA